MQCIAMLLCGSLVASGHAATTLLGQDLSQPFAAYDWLNPPGSDIQRTSTYDNGKAVGLTIAAGESYRLDSFSVVLQLMTDTGYPPTDSVGAAVHLDAGGNPGAVTASLGSIVVDQPTMTGAIYTFTAGSSVILTGGNTYWFSLSDKTQSDDALPFVHWTVMGSGIAPTGAAALAGYRFTADGGLGWTASSRANAMQIVATPVPEPEGLAMMLAGLCTVSGVVVRRRRVVATSA